MGLVFAGFGPAYVFLVVRPSDLVIDGRIATIVAAVWIGAGIGREIAYGVIRFVNSQAVDARSPDVPADRD
jgi:hypothetical protein